MMRQELLADLHLEICARNLPFSGCVAYTLRYSNMAMENHPFSDDIPSYKASILVRGFAAGHV